MSLVQAKKIINRSESTLKQKRVLRTIADALASITDPQTATNTADIAALIAEVQLVGSDAVIATTDGLTTGLILATTHYAQITSSVATKQVSLAAAIDGKHLYLMCFTNGCEVISSVAADKLNNVVIGATNEAALVAGTLYSLTYTADDGNWVMTGLTNTGAVEAPVVPDVR